MNAKNAKNTITILNFCLSTISKNPLPTELLSEDEGLSLLVVVLSPEDMALSPEDVALSPEDVVFSSEYVIFSVATGTPSLLQIIV